MIRLWRGVYDNEIGMVDLVCLKGTQVNNNRASDGRLVFSDDLGRFSLDLSSFEQFPSLDLSCETVERRLFNCIVRKCLIVDSMGDNVQSEGRTSGKALTVHQYKKEEVGYEFQEYIFTFATEEKCKIFDGGMIKDRVENLDTSVYVGTVSGKTISIGKVLNDKKTIEDSDIEAGAAIEMSLRKMGGMEKRSVDGNI